MLVIENNRTGYIKKNEKRKWAKLIPDGCIMCAKSKYKSQKQLSKACLSRIYTFDKRNSLVYIGKRKNRVLLFGNDDKPIKKSEIRLFRNFKNEFACRVCSKHTRVCSSKTKKYLKKIKDESKDSNSSEVIEESPEAIKKKYNLEEVTSVRNCFSLGENKENNSRFTLVDNNCLIQLINFLRALTGNTFNFSVDIESGFIKVNVHHPENGKLFTWISSNKVNYGRKEAIETVISAFEMSNIRTEKLIQGLAYGSINFTGRKQINRSIKRLREKMNKFVELSLEETKKKIRSLQQEGYSIQYISIDGQWSTSQKGGRRAKHNVVTFIVYMSNSEIYLVNQTFACREDLKNEQGEPRYYDMEGKEVKDLEKINVCTGLKWLFDEDIITDIISTDGCKSAVKCIRDIYAKLCREQKGVAVFANRDYFHFVPKMEKNILKLVNSVFKDSGIEDTKKELINMGLVDTISSFFLECMHLPDNIIEEIADSRGNKIERTVKYYKSSFSNGLYDHIESECGEIVENLTAAKWCIDKIADKYSEEYETFFDQEKRSTHNETFHSLFRGMKGLNLGKNAFKAKWGIGLLFYQIQVNRADLKTRKMRQTTKYGVKERMVMPHDVRVKLRKNEVVDPVIKSHLYEKYENTKKKKIKSKIIIGKDDIFENDVLDEFLDSNGRRIANENILDEEQISLNEGCSLTDEEDEEYIPSEIECGKRRRNYEEEETLSDRPKRKIRKR